MIHCALCFHNKGNFYRSVYMTLLSCFTNTQSTLHIHLVTDESVVPYRHLFDKLCLDHGHRLSWYAPPAVPQDIIDIINAKAMGGYTIASLYRLFLHELIAEDKILYFDCDLIIEKDIAELDALPLGDAYVIATHDPSRTWSVRKKNYYLKQLQIREDHYFNSGVLVMNLQALRKASEKGNIFLNQYRTMGSLAQKLSYPIYDQDLLNIMLSQDEEKLLLTSAEYNFELCLFRRRFLPLDHLQDKIFHFAALKPEGKFFPAHLLYWKYYAMSPWSEETFASISRRLADPRDKWMQMVMDCWQHPHLYKWLWKLHSFPPIRALSDMLGKLSSQLRF